MGRITQDHYQRVLRHLWISQTYELKRMTKRSFKGPDHYARYISEIKEFRKHLLELSRGIKIIELSMNEQNVSKMPDYLKLVETDQGVRIDTGSNPSEANAHHAVDLNSIIEITDRMKQDEEAMLEFVFPENTPTMDQLDEADKALMLDIRSNFQKASAHAIEVILKEYFSERIDDPIEPPPYFHDILAHPHGLGSLVPVEYSDGYYAAIEGFDPKMYGLDIQDEKSTIDPKLLARMKDPNNMYKVFQEFYEHKKVVEKVDQKILSSYERTYKLWDAVYSAGIPLNAFQTKSIKEFLSKISGLPKGNLAAYKGLPLEDLIETEIPEEDTISDKTVKEHLKVLQGIFKFAIDKGYLTSSPAKDVGSDFCEVKRYSNFSDTEVNRLMAGLSGQSKPWQKWVLLLGAYTGMRLGEIVSLKKESIKIDDDTQIHYIHVTDKYGGKVKTAAAIRRVPIHPKLIEEGFLDLVSQNKDKWLLNVDFPDFTRHRKAS
jgi:integrase